MSDLTKLKQILANQAERGVRDWGELSHAAIQTKKGEVTLEIKSLQVGFVFSKNGRLLGAYNWNETLHARYGDTPA
jgi:hypothetical protein